MACFALMAEAVIFYRRYYNEAFVNSDSFVALYGFGAIRTDYRRCHHQGGI